MITKEKKYKPEPGFLGKESVTAGIEVPHKGIVGVTAQRGTHVLKPTRKRGDLAAPDSRAGPKIDVLPFFAKRQAARRVAPLAGVASDDGDGIAAYGGELVLCARYGEVPSAARPKLRLRGAARVWPPRT